MVENVNKKAMYILGGFTSAGVVLGVGLKLFSGTPEFQELGYFDILTYSVVFGVVMALGFGMRSAQVNAIKNSS